MRYLFNFTIIHLFQFVRNNITLRFKESQKNLIKYNTFSLNGSRHRTWQAHSMRVLSSNKKDVRRVRTKITYNVRGFTYSVGCNYPALTATKTNKLF
jgi:hypothetical protein